MMHAMGFKHEQSRADRDDYLTVDLDQVKEGKKHNLKKFNTINRTPYDLESIMQYSLGVG